MIFLMIAIGGLTRLTESGLSMVDWKPIMGTHSSFKSKKIGLDAFNHIKILLNFKLLIKIWI